MIFSKFESKLFVELASFLGSNEELISYEYEGGIRSGHFQVGSKDDPIRLVFSFPINNDDCFFIATDGDAYEFCKEVASLQEFNDDTDHLCSGHTVPTSNEYMNSGGWVSHLISLPAVLSEDIPNVVDIFGRSIRLHLVIPLTQSEYDVKLSHGNDGLLDYLSQNNRDVVAFGVGV